jgi:threonine-phosphate decarboxylase
MSIQHGGDLFAIARERGWDWRDVLDLSASINPLGPPGGVREAIAGALDRIVHYPERQPSVLARRLGELWNVDPDGILLGNGATELLHFYARVVPQPATLVVPTFSEFHRAYPEARLAGLDEPWPGDGLLVLTRPNNPLGVLSAVPRREQPLLVDESFLEFTETPSAAGAPNVLVLRSLTKFYALPGLRIGALVGDPAVIRPLLRHREPWQVNVLAEAAALAAITDSGYAARSARWICTERAWIWDQLIRLPGIRPVRSCANYFLVYCDGAGSLCGWFLERKILLRDQTGTPGLKGECFRFAVRTRPENQRFLDLLGEYLCAS